VRSVVVVSFCVPAGAGDGCDVRRVHDRVAACRVAERAAAHFKRARSGRAPDCCTPLPPEPTTNVGRWPHLGSVAAVAPQDVRDGTWPDRTA